MLAWLSILVVAVSTSQAADTEPASPPAPEAGDGGYRVAHTGLWVGGYATIEGTVPESEPASVGLGDLGLLVRYELTPTLAFFNETDLDDAVTLVEHSGLERGSRILLLERLYVPWTR